MEDENNNDEQKKPNWLIIAAFAGSFLFIFMKQMEKGENIVSAFFVSIFGTIFVGGAIAVVILGVTAGIVGHAKEVSKDPSILKKGIPYYMIIAGIAFGIWYYQANKPTYYPSIPTPQSRPVDVDGYNRSDGSYVSAHDRAPPGQKAAYDRRDSARSEAWMRQYDAIEAIRIEARNIGIFIFVLFCGPAIFLIWKRNQS